MIHTSAGLLPVERLISNQVLYRLHGVLEGDLIALR
jgi:hypothetical protein